MKRFKYLILGAGPTGLGAAHRLKEIGETDFLVMDKSHKVGGLSQSYLDEKGFTWDIGGHVQFSHYDYFDQVMINCAERNKWYEHERESWVWMDNRFIPYPLQNNIRHLTKDKMLRCLWGLLIKKERGRANFGDWIQNQFGPGIADIFLNPYNKKVWAYEPEEMNFEWIGERVATVDVRRIIKNILTQKDDVSWGPNNTFTFPHKEGTGFIWKSIAEKIGMDYFKLNCTVRSINTKTKTVLTANGEEYQYEELLSTIPADKLLRLLNDLDPKLSPLSHDFKYSSSNIVGIGVKGKLPTELQTKSWMYFPESNSPFYRVTVFSNYSPSHVPNDSYYSLMTETSASPKKPVDYAELVKFTIEGLKQNKLINPSDEIVTKWFYHAHYGYPTPFLGRDPLLKKVHAELELREIYSRGRFGGWKYEVSNQDHSFMQGVEWVNRVAQGQNEETYQY